jgi:paraquat-inducible protein B
VGAFVLGAVALALGAVLALSSGSWLEERVRFSVYFPGSVRGLGPGAPVTFRGVKVGKVVDVTAFLTGRPDLLIQIEVVLELQGGILEVAKGLRDPFEDLSPQEFSEALIARGVRARMASASLLTGQRFIELDFLPDDPARFAGLSPRYPELPTTPTALERIGDRAEEFLERLAELPLADMLDDVRRAIRSVRDLLESEAIRNAFDSANQSARTFARVLDQVELALDDSQSLIRSLDSQATETGEQAREMLAQARATLDDAERSLASMEEALLGTDDARLQLMTTLDEVSRAMKALSNLVDYVQTHPESVVLGKGLPPRRLQPREGRVEEDQ